MIIGVIDGLGGGIGAHVVERLRKSLPEDAKIVALGTNAIATSNMMKAGANKGASGENAIRHMAPRLDLITGGLGITQPHSMLGEITPGMVEAIVQSPARKVLMPLKTEAIEIVGLKDEPIPHLIEEVAQRVASILGEARNV